MVFEAFFIVFAVLVALAVDEWSQSRELREQSERARTAVVSELEANLAELRVGGPSTIAMLEWATEMVRSLRRGETPATNFEGELPEFSDAAWETARVTGLVARLEYEWVLQTARAYQLQALTLDLQRDVLATIGSAVVRAPDLERLTDLRGQLVILTLLHDQLGERYMELLGTVGESAGD